MKEGGNIKVLRLMALLASRAMQYWPHAEWLDLEDAAVLVIKEGVTVWSAVGYFFNFPDLFLFDIRFGSMKPPVFFALQKEEFIVVV
jgi:hypothetical protein